MKRHLRDSTFVVLVCTESWLRRVEGDDDPARGRGVRWEGPISYDQFLYDGGPRNTRFLPVYYGDDRFIPKLLRAYSRFDLSAADGYRALLAHMAGRPAASAAELGRPLAMVEAAWDDADVPVKAQVRRKGSRKREQHREATAQGSSEAPEVPEVPRAVLVHPESYRAWVSALQYEVERALEAHGHDLEISLLEVASHEVAPRWEDVRDQVDRVDHLVVVAPPSPFTSEGWSAFLTEALDHKERPPRLYWMSFGNAPTEHAGSTEVFDLRYYDKEQYRDIVGRLAGALAGVDAIELEPDVLPPLWPDLEEDAYLPVHEDGPAIVDELATRPFAQVLAMRILQQRARSVAGSGPPSRDFAVHVHGPWGAGKTSVLNFLQKELESQSNEDWIVVQFDAWRYARLRPTWWFLIREVYRQGLETIQRHSRLQAISISASWTLWRAQADWFSYLVAIAVFSAAGWLAHEYSDEVTPLMALGGTLSSLAVAAYAVTRRMVFGSAKAASAYLEYREDPLKPVVNTFGKLVHAFERPLAIFIDDLDRCRGDYVVELLNGIQTLLRGFGVTYVVAADQEWLRASFEDYYEDLQSSGGAPGRPLGYLFLEKMFQISAAVPSPSPDLRRSFLNRLLTHERPPEYSEHLNAADRAKEILGDSYDERSFAEAIAGAESDPVLQLELRAEAARRLASESSQRSLEHELARFGALIEPNPRAIKRFVNMYGMRRAVHYLEDRRVSTDGLARWTVLEMRWPLLAGCLAQDPSLVQRWRKGELEAASLPASIASLLGDPSVLEVIGGLDESEVRRIVGSPGAQESLG